MIGWYHTGPKLRASDQEINDLFKRFIAKPVMVIVDVQPNTVGIPTDAYFAVEEIKDVSPYHHSISGSFSDGHQDGTETRKAFLRVPPEPKPKKLALRIYYGISKIPQRQHAGSPIPAEFVEVSTGTMPANHQIVYYLQESNLADTDLM